MPLSLQLILICLTSLGAAFVGSYSGRVSASLLLRKRVTELETEVAVLTSELRKVLDLTKKISNRVALDEHRHKSPGRRAENGDAPPPGDKQAAKRFYLQGKTHADIARQVMNGGE